jgi:hypothetical protein
MDLLDDLGPQLRALTSGQPAQPGDRVPGVTRRARRIRRTRAALAVAASLAVLAPAGVLVASSQHHEAARYARNDLSTWPDRSYAADRGVAEGAVAYWSSSSSDEGGLRLTDRLHWLFRGTVPLPDQEDQYVAVFVADHGANRVLVISHTKRSDVNAHGASSNPDDVPMTTPWVDQELPLTHALDHVGLYLQDFSTGHNRNVLFLLAAPSARQVRLTSSPLPAGPRGPVQWTAESRDGVFVSHPVTIDGPVTASVYGDPATWKQTFSFGTGQENPHLVAPALPDVAARFSSLGTSPGDQSEQQDDGRWSFAGFSDSTDFGSRAVSLYARCYGGGAAHLSATSFDMTHDGAGNGEVTSAETGVAAADVPCDGHTHAAFQGKRIPRNTLNLTWTTDRLQALSYVFGYDA